MESNNSKEQFCFLSIFKAIQASNLLRATSEDEISEHKHRGIKARTRYVIAKH